MNSKSRLIVFLALTMTLCLVLGGLIGYSLNNFSYLWGGASSSGLSSEQLRVLNDAQKYIEQYAIEEHDSATTVDYALKGIAASLDDEYAYYSTAAGVAEYERSSSGIVSGGVGANITMRDGEVVISEIYKGLSADAAGLKAGDVIVGVDGVSTKGMSTSEVVLLVRGEENTIVNITVRRGEYELSFAVTRTNGQRQMTEYRMLPGGILYIKIFAFHGNAAEYFKKAIAYGRAQSFKAVLIDLRENLGGDVTAFEAIADVMLPAGETFCARSRDGKKIMTCYSDSASVDLPTVVLVNGSSASASEALAGALRDNGGAILVGEQTYGKGVMQTSYGLSNGGVLKFTTAYYYLPGGDCIHGEGLTPDYEVSLPDELTSYFWLRTEENDLQYQKAIDVLTEKIS